MKYFVLAALVFGFSQMANAENFGKQVKIYADNVGPQFGTVFSYDVDTMWTLTISLWGGDLLPDFSMKTLSWRLFDAKSGKYVNEWTTATNNSSPVMYPGTIAFSWSLEKTNEALAAIEALPTLKLVLSVDQDLSAPIPTHFVDLGSYCDSNPGKFVNLTSGNPGCNVE